MFVDLFDPFLYLVYAFVDDYLIGFLQIFHFVQRFIIKVFDLLFKLCERTLDCSLDLSLYFRLQALIGF